MSKMTMTTMAEAHLDRPLQAESAATVYKLQRQAGVDA